MRELLPVDDVADVLRERPVRAAGVGRRGARQVPGRVVEAGPRGDHPVAEGGLVGPEVAIGSAQVERTEVRQRRAPQVARHVGAEGRHDDSASGSAARLGRGRLELIAELDGAPVGRPDGLGQDGPQPARLELVERGRRRPAGRGDHVAQLGRVHPGLLGEERRALERLDDEVVGDVPREAEMDRRVDERLHDEEDVRRAGAATPPSPSRPSSRRRPRAGGRARPGVPRPAPRWSSVVSGVAYQTVMPLPSRAGVFGMLRTTWSWPRNAGQGRRWSRRRGRSGRAGRAGGAARSRGRPCRASAA